MNASVYRFSNCNTGGELGRGMAKMSFVACPIYMKKAQRMDTCRATAPSTFHILRENRQVALSDEKSLQIYQVGKNRM